MSVVLHSACGITRTTILGQGTPAQINGYSYKRGNNEMKDNYR